MPECIKMAYEFFFKSTRYASPNFSRQLESMQCEGRAADGNRCKQLVTIGLPYCQSHQLSEAHVKIMNSPGKGQGLYAFSSCANATKDTIVFQKGDRVMETYMGEVIAHDELMRRYGDGDTYNAPYTIAFHKHPATYIDAACKRGLASIVNHARGLKGCMIEGYQYANCIYRINGDHDTPDCVYIGAARDIYHGEELLVDYGGDATAMDVDDTPLYSNPSDIVTGTRRIG
jgi:SET domain